MTIVRISEYMILMWCLIPNIIMKLSFAATINDFNPPYKKNLSSNNYSQSAGQEDGQLRSFFMNNVEDKQICQITWLRDLIVGEDGSGIGWWSNRCFSGISTLREVSRKQKVSKTKDSTFEITKEVTEKLSKNYRAGQCRPIRQMVEIQSNDTSGAIFIPCTVVVKRCAGCCISTIKECTPTKTREKIFLVVKVVPTPQQALNEKRKYSIPKDSPLVQKIRVTEDRECDCLCKVKHTDCNIRQQYDSESCSCVCPATVKRTCDSAKKVWSEKNCDCRCRRESECTTGLRFNRDSCRCAMQNSIPRLFNLKPSNEG